MIAGSSCIPAEVLCISGLLQGPEQPNISEDLWRGHLQWHNKWLQCGECELRAINSRILVICEPICELGFMIWSWQSPSYLKKGQSVGRYFFWCTRFVSFVVVVEQVLAKKFGAAIVTLEHRYYGESSPFEDLTSENLKYLSSNQALFDLAAFRKFFQVLMLFFMCWLLNIPSLERKTMHLEVWLLIQTPKWCSILLSKGDTVAFVHLQAE